MFKILIAVLLTVTAFPDTAEERWLYSLAIQAATWGAPLVTMYTLRDHETLGQWAINNPNSLTKFQEVVTPALTRALQYPSPDVNVLYGFGFMDLRQEPVVVTVPDSNGLYYLMQIVDMWGNSFAYIGGKATGYQAGQYLLTGPGWTGKVPPGVSRIDCPTSWVLLRPGIHAFRDQKLDLFRARAVLNQMEVEGLSEFLGQDPLPVPEYNYPSPVIQDPSQSVGKLDFKDPLQFWDILMRAVAENPPPQDQIEALMPLFTPLGLQFGSIWDRAALSSSVIQAMNAAAVNIPGILNQMVVGTGDEGADIAPPSIGNYGTDYLTRAVIIRRDLAVNTPQETVQWIYFKDKGGRDLDGSKAYTLTFKEEPQYLSPGFWSLTMYDKSTNYIVQNIINRYFIGSDTQGLKKNKDGSITIYIQPTSPGKDKESNWLPSMVGQFYLLGRIYAPTEAMVDIITHGTPEKLPHLIP